jgi:3-phenylpropionate/trans-cinnamate dioxygenase ferredoxin reductase subunit
VTETIVIAGAGHAAGQAVATLKQKKFAGRIVLVGEEPHSPYQRPPLSKKYLAGKLQAERLYLKPAAFYEDPQCDMRLGVRIDGIDRDASRLITADGEDIAYTKLILALGSRVRKIPVAGSDLDGVHYLRNIEDVNHIRAGMTNAQHLVVIGAGYIGLEVAAVCRERGLDVTVIEMADRVLSRVVSPAVSDFFQAKHAGHGVKLLLSTKLDAFQGSGRVESVRIVGGQEIPADLCIVGVGIVPNTELAEAAGLEVDDGIVVDEMCRTSDHSIYAIGDCTSHPNSIYRRRVRLESVHNAIEQAKTAASNLCGSKARYSQVPWFWSDQYDLKLQIAGLSQGYDQTILRGNPDDGNFACLYLREGSLIAVDAINSPRDFVQAKELIASRAVIDPALLADTNVALKDLR